MDMINTEEETMLREQVAGLFATEATAEHLRKLIDAGEQTDPALWQSLAELGMLAAAIPEEYGGVGLGLSALCVVAEEVGRAVAPVPFFSSTCLAAEAIVQFGTEAQKQCWLPRLATGEAIGTFAWSEGEGSLISGPYTAQFGASGLSGSKSPVPNAAIANICVVATQYQGEHALVVVELDQDAVQLTPLDGFDELCHHARLDFASAAAELLEGSAEQGALLTFFGRAAVVKAFEQIGGAEAALYMARDYSLERYTFGRQIGSYQAIKHKLAGVLVEIELARSNALAAARAYDAGEGDLAMAATARVAATHAYELGARENLQTHGGIGYTWEADCHFHYRRARLTALELGSVESWADILIDQLSSGQQAGAA